MELHTECEVSMEIQKGAEALVKDSVGIAKNVGTFVVERMIGGAWAEIGRLAHISLPEIPDNIIRGDE